MISFALLCNDFFFVLDRMIELFLSSTKILPTSLNKKALLLCFCSVIYTHNFPFSLFFCVSISQSRSFAHRFGSWNKFKIYVEEYYSNNIYKATSVFENHRHQRKKLFILWLVLYFFVRTHPPQIWLILTDFIIVWPKRLYAMSHKF